MPLLANAEKIRRFTPMTPTIDKPETVINVVPFILEMPLDRLLVFGDVTLNHRAFSPKD